MNLTKPQENLLKDLLRDEVWTGLLDDIAAAYRAPEWKPGGVEEEKHAKWIYESGGQRRVTDLLTLLRLGS